MSYAQSQDSVTRLAYKGSWKDTHITEYYPQPYVLPESTDPPSTWLPSYGMNPAKQGEPDKRFPQPYKQGSFSSWSWAPYQPSHAWHLHKHYTTSTLELATQTREGTPLAHAFSRYYYPRPPSSPSLPLLLLPLPCSVSPSCQPVRRAEQALTRQVQLAVRRIDTTL